MPRIYNWTEGEGSYKSLEGLGFTNDMRTTVDLQSTYGDTFGINLPDLTSQYEVIKGGLLPNKSLGQQLKDNWIWLAVGGIAFLFLRNR